MPEFESPMKPVPDKQLEGTRNEFDAFAEEMAEELGMDKLDYIRRFAEVEDELRAELAENPKNTKLRDQLALLHINEAGPLHRGSLHFIHEGMMHQEKSRTDKVTGLMNRHAFDEQIAKKISSRSKKSTGEGSREMKDFIVIMDVDRFKSVNDNYGHTIGDKMLRHIANIIKKATRDNDTVARHGGDEFSAIVSAKDYITALGIAERVRQDLVENPLIISITTADEPPEQIIVSSSLSIGVAPIIESGKRKEEITTEDIEDVINPSDTAAYQAKMNGRNKVYGIDPQKKKGEVHYLRFDPDNTDRFAA